MMSWENSYGMRSMGIDSARDRSGKKRLHLPLHFGFLLPSDDLLVLAFSSPPVCFIASATLSRKYTGIACWNQIHFPPRSRPCRPQVIIFLCISELFSKTTASGAQNLKCLFGAPRLVLLLEPSCEHFGPCWRHLWPSGRVW